MSALPGTTGRRRIYLMRHGHVDYFANAMAGRGPHEAPLTRLGREQAMAAGKALSHVRFDLVMSSGYPRTHDTLALVLAENQAPPPETEIETDMVELKNGRPVGATSRQDMARLMARHFDTATEPGATMFQDGEIFVDAIARAEAAMTRLLARPNWHTALVVAHEGINRMVLGWMTGNGLAAVSAFEQDLACINVLDFDLAPSPDGQGTVIERRIIKAQNLTPYNYVKHGMNLTSLEFIFEPYEEQEEG